MSWVVVAPSLHSHARYSNTLLCKNNSQLFVYNCKIDIFTLADFSCLLNRNHKEINSLLRKLNVTFKMQQSAESSEYSLVISWEISLIKHSHSYFKFNENKEKLLREEMKMCKNFHLFRKLTLTFKKALFLSVVKTLQSGLNNHL